MLGQRVGSRFEFVGSAVYPADDEGSAGAFTSQDATSLIFVPATAGEFASAGRPAPSHVWDCQAASGNQTDSAGGKTLTAAGTVAYQQAVAGWATKALGGAAAGVAGNFANATMENLNANSVAFLVYSIWTATAAAVVDRLFHGAASVNSVQANAAGNVQRIRTGANAANGALSHVGAVHPYLVVWDRTGARNTLYSDIEKVNITWADTAGATFELNMSTADASYTQKVLRAYSWIGANAEYFTDATVKSMLQQLGWTVSGY